MKAMRQKMEIPITDPSSPMLFKKWFFAVYEPFIPEEYFWANLSSSVR
jgi:hypothetical protein